MSGRLKLITRAFALACLSLLIAPTFFLLSVSAQTAPTITASSTAGTVSKDARFQVTLYVNSAEEVTVAQALITYDKEQLVLVGEPSYNDSPLNQESPDNVGGNGYYQLSRFKMGETYPSGTFKLAEITFQALVDSGDATVAVDSAGSGVFTRSDPTVNSLSSTRGVSVRLDPYSETPHPGTQLIFNGQDGNAELKSTPPASDGNNGTATDIDTPTEEEKAAFAETTANRTEQANKNNQAAADEDEPIEAWRIGLGVVVVLAATAVVVLLLRQTGKGKAVTENGGGL